MPHLSTRKLPKTMDANRYLSHGKPIPLIGKVEGSTKKLPRPENSDFYIVHFSFDYFDDEADITTLNVATTGPGKSGETVALYTLDLLGIKGKNGKARYQAVFNRHNPSGRYHYSFQLIDAKGNESLESSISVNLIEKNIPWLKIIEFTPLSGSVGDVIAITGVGLDSSSIEETRVSIGGKNAKIREISPDKIVFLVPAGVLTGSLAVSNARGIAHSAKPFEVRPSISISGNGQRILAPMQAARFKAIVTGLTDPLVLWSVNDTPGGSIELGIIDRSGTYTAPVVPPTSGHIEISAAPATDPSLRSSTRIELVTPLPRTGPCRVDRRTGGHIQEENGLLTLDIPPTSLNRDLDITILSAEFLDTLEDRAGVPDNMMPLVKFKVQVTEEKSLKGPVYFRLLLPIWIPPETELILMVHSEKKYVDNGWRAKVSGNGIFLQGLVSVLNQEVFIVHRVDTPLTLPPPEVISVKVPLAEIEEGRTLPVLIQGSRFYQGTRVSASDPGLNQHLIFGPVFVNTDGTQLGFTLRIKPIRSLPGGGSLPVAFRIRSLTGTVHTNPSEFVIRGLPELIVSRDPNSNLYRVDDPVDVNFSLKHIDHAVNDSNRYSTLIVEEGAVLGIGSSLTEVRADGLTWDVSTVDGIENALGRLNWNYDANDQRINNNIQLFQPTNRPVTFDVTGPVYIRGTIYFAGMKGGENPKLNHPSGPGHRRLGGFANGTLSGGAGGDGGVTTDQITRDGQLAGNNNTPDLGIGRMANGRLLQAPSPAGFGSRFDPETIEYLDYFRFWISIYHLVSLGRAIDVFRTEEPDFDNVTDAASKGVDVGKDISRLATTMGLPSVHIAAGQGGHGGLRPSGVSARLTKDSEVIPGSGGGGGGGGGSSSYTETLFGITLGAQEWKGGGGAGGGGAAGALRITTSSALEIDGSGYINGVGGRGGFGEPHHSLASPGGGGGGGTGGVCKLQSPQLINRGVIDLSGGHRSGSVVGQSDFLAPIGGGRIQILPGPQKGGFLCYGSDNIGVYPPRVKVLWPTGRLRAELPLSFAQNIRAIGTAENIPFIFPGFQGLLILTDVMRLVVASSVDYLSGNPEISFLSEWINLNTVPELSGFIPTDVAQSPSPPHHIFISGVDGTGGFAMSQVHEFDLGGTYLGRRFYIQTTVGFGPGHLTEIEFLSDGRLVGQMTPNDQSGAGIRAIDLQTGASSLILHWADFNLASMSVFRGKVQDQFYLSTTHYVAGVQSPSPTIERYDVATRRKTSQIALVAETISAPGEPGLLRLDGSLPASNVPQIKFDDLPLPNLNFPAGSGTPSMFNSPVIGSFYGPIANSPGFESLVFGRSRLSLYCHGGEQGEPVDLKKESQQNPQTIGVATLRPDQYGQFDTTLQMDPGFNTVWVETNVGGDTPELLKRHVLYIPGA